jgi:hypothetical protein
MFHLNLDQARQIQDLADDRFIRAEAEHLATSAAPMATWVGEQGIKRTVALGLTLARQAGFDEAKQIRLYLQLMVAFGSNFGTDPQYRWLHPFLDPNSGVSTIERARLLYWHATLYLDRVFGEKGEHGASFGARALRVDLPMLERTGEAYYQKAAQLLARLHPQRSPYMAEDSLEQLLDKAPKLATQYQLGGAAAAPLILCLMFGFGYSMDDDPWHPWVHEHLSNTGLGGTAKTAKLHAAAQGKLALMIDHARKVQS